MAYVITNTRGQTIATILTGEDNTTATDVTLIGQNYIEFGLAQNENFVHILENFAAPTPPTHPIQGQLWFDTANGELKVRYDVNTWSSLADQNYVQAQKVSPVFTGTPRAPTAPSGTTTTQLATTAFVRGEIASIDLAPFARLDGAVFTGNLAANTAPLGTVTTQVATTAFARNLFDDTASSLYVTKVDGELLGNARAPTLANIFTNSNRIATTQWVQSLYGNTFVSPYGPKDSPAFSGVPTAPTAPVSTSNTQIATTGFVQTLFANVDLSPYAPKASPVLTGTPRSTTANASDNSTQIATTNFVQLQKVSPAFTGVPTAPTAANTTSNTQIATTAFVTGKISEINASGAQELAGSVKLWISETPPNGWALCNGQAVSRTTYATLFARIGTTYGAGDGTTTFNVPNLSARFPIGVGTGYALGSTGGSADIPVITHTHSGSTNSAGDHQHSHVDRYFPVVAALANQAYVTSKQQMPSSPPYNGYLGEGAADRDNTFWLTYNDTTGSAGSHNHVISINAPDGAVSGTGRNIPPYQTFYYIIKLSDDGSGGGTLEAGAGIDIATGNGRSTITNVGVRRLIAGSGITLSSETGNITISSSGGGSGTADIAGTIKIWGGATEPTDWMFCDGRAISRTEYVSLFSRLGTAFGAGDGSTTFNIPDFRDRTAVGSSATKARGSSGNIGSGGGLAAFGTITRTGGTIPVNPPGSGGSGNFTGSLPASVEGQNITVGPILLAGTLFTAPTSASSSLTYTFTQQVTFDTALPNTNYTVDADAAYNSTIAQISSNYFPIIDLGIKIINKTVTGFQIQYSYFFSVGAGTAASSVVWSVAGHPQVRIQVANETGSSASGVGYESAPYIIKVNDNGTQRSGSGGGDTSRAGDVKWVAYASNNFPPGWQLCDGSELLRASYPALFARIGTTYGAGNGTTTFNVPDLRGRFIASETAGATGANRASITRGSVGGSADAVVVSHTHSITDPGHSHQYTTKGGNQQSPADQWNGIPGKLSDNIQTTANVTGISIQSSGESGTGKNLPPYVGMVAMIKLDDDTVNTGGIIQAGPGISITTSGSYATISSTVSQNPVVAGPGITVQNSTGGALVSANVRNIVAGTGVSINNNNGNYTINSTATSGSITAWAHMNNVNGIRTLLGSYNINSVSVGSNYYYTFNFVTPMQNSNYCVVATVYNTDGAVGMTGIGQVAVTSQSNSSFTVYSRIGSGLNVMVTGGV